MKICLCRIIFKTFNWILIFAAYSNDQWLYITTIRNERLINVTDKIYLPSTFNHDECQNVFNDCKRVLDMHDSIVFNGSVVERIGTVGVQILLSVGVYCQKFNKKCVIETPSLALMDAFAQLGCINIVKKLGMVP